MRIRSVVPFVVVMLLTACGDPSSVGSPGSAGTTRPSTSTVDGDGQPSPPPTGPPPATSVPVAPAVGSAPLSLPDPVEVREPCPESTGVTSSGDGSEMMSESSRLEPMLGITLAYGSEHPDEWGTYGLVWHDAGDASVFVSFTGHLDEHRAALADLVELPDELIVCQVALPGAASQALAAALTAELTGRFTSIGQGAGPIEIVLPATEEALAHDLVERYDDAIQLTVGVLAYPLDEATAVCREPDGDDPAPGLEVAIVAPNDPIVSNGVQPAHFEVLLTNTGDAPIRFTTGTAIGTILDTDGNVVATSGGVALADVGIPIDLAPGASMTLPGIVDTASCDPRLGYVVPPGDYLLVASFSRSDTALTYVLTPPEPIVVGG